MNSRLQRSRDAGRRGAWGTLAILAGGLLSCVSAHARDLDWPRTATVATGHRVTLSQPQATQWHDGILDAKIAVGVTPPGAKEIVGTISVRARTTIDRQSATIVLREITMPALRFGADEATTAACRTAVETAISSGPIVARLDDLLALLPAHGFPEAPREPGPPSSTPTIPSFAGLTFEPVVAGSLDGCSGSAVLLFRASAGDHYLFVGGRWLATASLAAPTWQWIDPGALPTSFAQIPENSRFADALVGVIGTAANRRALLANTLAEEPRAPGKAPSVGRYPAPATLNDPTLWWNPWTLSFWPGSCAVTEVPAFGDLPEVPNSQSSILRHDSAAENRFVGLDGRVYAHRVSPTTAAAWVRASPDGSWSEFTLERSTLRNLKSDLGAREDADVCAEHRAAWSRREVEARAAAAQPRTGSPCDRLRSMDGVRPQTGAFRCVPASLALPQEAP